MVDDSFRHGLALDPGTGQEKTYLAEPAQTHGFVANDARYALPDSSESVDGTGLEEMSARDTAHVAEVRYLHAEDAALNSAQRNVQRPFAVAGKRLLDIFAAAILVMMFSPLMAVLALWIKLSNPGSVFYRHTRVGRYGVTFDCLKFRTMVTNADAVLAGILAKDPHATQEWRETRKLQNDPRVTRAGRFLRRWRLDELPQLFNVIAGQMSLVGPRPVVKEELSRYGRSAAYYLMVQPGITGPWQVSARGTTTYAERIKLDSHYVTNWSLGGDVVLLLKTIPAVLRGHGV